jgi:chemotaxis protein methyltransferase CheR
MVGVPSDSDGYAGVRSGGSARPEGMCAVRRKEALSHHDFRKLCRLIHDYCGILIVPAKQTMLEGRISRRVKHLGFSGLDEYCAYLFSTKGMAEEFTPMIDVVTTNKTDFFREPWHFEFLRQTALPALEKLHGAGKTRKLTLWSAACSSGEEPHTIAMVLAEAAVSRPDFSYSILATDLSSRILDHARKAVYDHERIDPVPLALRKKYLLKSRDRAQGLVRIVPELREKVMYRRQNLLETNYNLPHLMDVIFCRNVIIYFDRPTQEAIIRRLCDCLVPEGFLFTGHTEMLTGMKAGLRLVAASTYQKIT